jgi:hypothetical protein
MLLKKLGGIFLFQVFYPKISQKGIKKASYCYEAFLFSKKKNYFFPPFLPLVASSALAIESALATAANESALAAIAAASICA